MKFVTAAIVLGCMYPSAFFAIAAGAGGGSAAAGDVIQEEGQQVTSVSVESIRIASSTISNIYFIRYTRTLYLIP